MCKNQHLCSHYHHITLQLVVLPVVQASCATTLFSLRSNVCPELEVGSQSDRPQRTRPCWPVLPSAVGPPAGVGPAAAVAVAGRVALRPRGTALPEPAHRRAWPPQPMGVMCSPDGGLRAKNKGPSGNAWWCCGTIPPRRPGGL